MRKKELLTRIEALERKIAQQADLIEQLRLGQMKYGPGIVQPAQPFMPTPVFQPSPTTLPWQFQPQTTCEATT